MLAHRRSEIYSESAKAAYPGNPKAEDREYTALEKSIQEAKKKGAGD